MTTKFGDIAGACSYASRHSLFTALYIVHVVAEDAQVQVQCCSVKSQSLSFSCGVQATTPVYPRTVQLHWFAVASH